MHVGCEVEGRWSARGEPFGLIVLRHTANLFCHQRGSHSSYGALGRCIESLASSTISSTWSRGQIRSIVVSFCKHVPFAISRHKTRKTKRSRDDAGLRTMPPCGRCRPADDVDRGTMSTGGAFWTNRAEADGQLVLSPMRLPEQLRTSR